MIEVKNLTKKFNRVTALNGVSFQVNKGEVFAYLGPNGAGKTTTVNILATLLTPTSGKATVAGYDVTKNGMEVRRLIGYYRKISGSIPRSPFMRISISRRVYTESQKRRGKRK